MSQLMLFDPRHHEGVLPSIVEMHVNCILYDDCLLRFRPPFTADKRGEMLAFWKDRVAQVRAGKRIILMTVAVDAQGNVIPSGIVEMTMPESDCGLFRSSVEMLMVSHEYRGQGLARKLMVEVERIARERGLTLLQLGTTVGSSAEQYVYPKLGYIKYGVVPAYGITPKDGTFADGAYFYKDLRKSVPLVSD